MGLRMHLRLFSGGAAATGLILLMLSRSVTAADPPRDAAAPPPPAAKDADNSCWHRVATADPSLWESCRFGGDGEVTFAADRIHLGVGDPLTGVRCLTEIPRENFEIQLEARRTSGFDFFCGLTFPIGEGHASLILGGWAGGIAGLSSIDGEDASDNATKRLMHFDNDRWYPVRVRVDAERVQAWVDDQRIVDQPRGDHQFDIRAEMDPSLPLGMAAFQCDAELRNFRWRKLEDGQ